MKADKKELIKEQQIMDLVKQIRKERPRTGTRKLYAEIKPLLKDMNIKTGRDKLNRLLSLNNLLVKKTKRFHITTDSKHHFYKSPNRIKDIEIRHAEQAFVADITYIKTDKGHTYLALVTALYSKKIMGYQYATI